MFWKDCLLDDPLEQAYLSYKCVADAGEGWESNLAPNLNIRFQHPISICGGQISTVSFIISSGMVYVWTLTTLKTASSSYNCFSLSGSPYVHI